MAAAKGAWVWKAPLPDEELDALAVEVLMPLLDPDPDEEEDDPVPEEEEDELLMVTEAKAGKVVAIVDPPEVKVTISSVAPLVVIIEVPMAPAMAPAAPELAVMEPLAPLIM